MVGVNELNIWANCQTLNHNCEKLSCILDDSTSVWITNVCVQQYYQPQSQLLLLLCNILLASITIVRSCHGYWMIPLMWEHLIRVPLCWHEVIFNGWKIYLNCSSNAIFHIPSSFFQASKARLRKKFDIIFPFLALVVKTFVVCRDADSRSAALTPSLQDDQLM